MHETASENLSKEVVWLERWRERETEKQEEAKGGRRNRRKVKGKKAMPGISCRRQVEKG